MSEPKQAEVTQPVRPLSLRQALRDARVEAADRSGVVIDLRDAELVRLELLNDTLDDLFSDLPPDNDMFDRALSHGYTPRLWIDMVAHVVMGRDKRTYRFVKDTRHGRITVAESHEIPVLAEAITRYVARRLLEKEKAFEPVAATPEAPLEPKTMVMVKYRSRWGSLLFGVLLGLVIAAGLLVAAAIHM